MRPCTSRKCAGPKPAPTVEQGTGTLCPREQTWENTCDAVLSECESTRRLSPRTQPLPISPWMSERAESSTHGRRWCGGGIMWMRGYPLPTAAADVGLVSCEWEGVLYPRQPLMWGWNHVNKSVLKTASPQQCPLAHKMLWNFSCCCCIVIIFLFLFYNLIIWMKIA